MSGGGTQKSLRKALGALKDTTTVSLAKVNSDYKVLRFVCFCFGWFSQLMHLIFIWALNLAGIGCCYSQSYKSC